MELEIGKVTHYYDHLHVAVLRLNEGLRTGDRLHIQGHSTDFTKKVTSMEVDHHTVTWVKPGDEVAIKVIEPAHEHDTVYRIAEEEFAP